MIKMRKLFIAAFALMASVALANNEGKPKPHAEVEAGGNVCRVTFYTPDEIPLEKGQKVRVHGGVFDKMEGILVKTYKKRNKQLAVIIPDILAASANVDPEYLEIIP